MAFLPQVVKAEQGSGFLIHLTFSDGRQKTVDFLPWLDGPMFEPLKQPEYFRRFFVEGGTVNWPNGADIAPETLYDASPAVEPAQLLAERGGSRTTGT